MTVRFVAMIDREDRPRDDADKHLAPARVQLSADGMTIVNTVKGIYGLVCTCDKPVFESYFGTPLYGREGNWSNIGPIKIPDALTKLGVISVSLDQMRRATC